MSAVKIVPFHAVKNGEFNKIKIPLLLKWSYSLINKLFPFTFSIKYFISFERQKQRPTNVDILFTNSFPKCP